MTWTDEELVARSISGDAESFNELILRWERPIYALAYRQIGREEDARDVCQETFLRAYRALGGFRGQAKFSSWLYRIALNLCRDWVRRERRTPVVQAPDDVDLLDLAATREPSESIEELVARNVRRASGGMSSLPGRTGRPARRPLAARQVGATGTGVRDWSGASHQPPATSHQLVARHPCLGASGRRAVVPWNGGRHCEPG